MLRGLKQRFPQVHLKAFTMVEIAYLARRTKISIREKMERLRDAAGGAEIFNERVRRIICDHKIDGNEWLETARIAHQLGLRSNCTMLYGHLENDEDRADHLVRLRALQDETHGFVTYIPLAFHPDNTALQHVVVEWPEMLCARSPQYPSSADSARYGVSGRRFGPVGL